MSVFDFKDPVIYQRRTQPYPEIEESHVIPEQAKILLSEVPSKFENIEVKNKDTDEVYYLIEEGSPDENQVHINYLYGILTFDDSQIDEEVSVTFYGTGVFYIPAQRVFTKKGTEDIEETLQDLVDDVNEAEDKRQSNEQDRQDAEDTRETNEQDRIEAENERQDAYDSNLMIWQTPVDTYDDINSTYSDPELGWCVQTLDNNEVYRYDGDEWVYFGKFNLDGAVTQAEFDEHTAEETPHEDAKVISALDKINLGGLNYIDNEEIVQRVLL